MSEPATTGAPTATAFPAIPAPAPTWWRRPGLDVVDGRLALNGVDLEVLRGMGEPGTPEGVGIDACSPARSSMRW